MAAENIIQTKVNQNEAVHQTIYGSVTIGAIYHDLLDFIEPSLLPKPTFSVHSLNIQRNEEFLFRKPELRTLYEKLVISDRKASRPLFCVIHGFGGVGKIQMALEFAYEYMETFEAIFWVSADPEKLTELRRTYGAIGRKLGLISVTTTDEGEVEIIRSQLETEGKSDSLSTFH